MATWKVTPADKKSIVERNYVCKDDNTLIIETVWRGGEFLVYTDDDSPPKLEPGVDMLDCDYESEMVETFDGVSEDYNMDECDDETKSWLEEFFADDENNWLDLECEHGWAPDRCEMIIDCDLVIEKVED